MNGTSEAHALISSQMMLYKYLYVSLINWAFVFLCNNITNFFSVCVVGLLVSTGFVGFSTFPIYVYIYRYVQPNHSFGATLTIN